MPRQRKDLCMYYSRKRSMPQRSQWPLVYMKKQFFCFAHLKLRGKCQACSFDVCPTHCTIQDTCALCKTNVNGVNVPCGKHGIDIGNCKDCTGAIGYVSLDCWKLCSRHLKAKTTAHGPGSLKERTQFRQSIIQCLLCSNSNETLHARQKRNALLVQPPDDAIRRPSKRVKYDDSKIDRDKNLDDNKTNCTSGGSNIN